MSQPYTAANADAHGWALTQRLKEYQVHAAGADPALTPVPNRVAPLLDKLEAFLDHPPVPLATLSAEDRAAIVVGLTEALKPLIPSAADIAKELGTRLGNG